MIASVCNAIWIFSKKGVVLELPLFSSNVISLRGFLLHLVPKQHANVLIPGNLDSGRNGKLQLLRFDEAKNGDQACMR